MITKSQLVALSEFRHQLARFQRFSVAASREAGLTQTQYLLLLHIAGQRERDWATVGEIAARLQASPHGTAALITRGIKRGLITKRPSSEDRRRMEVRLTRRGAALVARVAERHRQELRALRHIIRIVNVSA